MIRLSRLLALCAPIALVACGSISVPAGEHIGEPIEARPVVKLAEVRANPSDYAEKTILAEGRITAVCQRKGCWMEVEDGGKRTLVRWETGCGGKYAFPKDAVGERIAIQGSIYPKEITKKDAEHMAEEAGHDLEIEEKPYEMNASAVVLLDRT